MEPLVLDIRHTDMLLGHDWLVHHNPTVNWTTGHVNFNRCPPDCKIKHSDPRINMDGRKYKTRMVEVGDPEAPRRTKNPPTTEPVIESTETPLPSYVKEFQHLFEKQNFDKLPKKRKWDHEINLTENAPNELGGKVYPMTHCEMEELDKVLDEGLATGKIRPSKSQQDGHHLGIQERTNQGR